MTQSPQTRRRFLAGATGTALTLGLAGCLSQGESTDDQGDNGDNHGDNGDDHSDNGDDHSDNGDDHSDNGDHMDDGEHGHGDIGDPTETAEVAVNTAMDGQSHFGPHVVRVTEGGTVTWVLESGSHTATAYHPDNDEPQLVPDGAVSWDSGTLSEEGETFEHTFETEGVYHYYCVPHEEGGMIASVIVGEPDAHGQPALEEPPEEKPDPVRAKLEELNEMCNGALGHAH